MRRETSTQASLGSSGGTPQGNEGGRVRLEVVQVVEHDGPPGAQPLGQQSGAVLREQPVGQGVLDHRLEARLGLPTAAAR